MALTSDPGNTTCTKASECCPGSSRGKGLSLLKGFLFHSQEGVGYVWVGSEECKLTPGGESSSSSSVFMPPRHVVFFLGSL